MKPRTYIIYLAILILLGAYYGYFELYRKNKAQQETEQAQKVFQIEPENVHKLTLKRRDGGEILIERNEDKTYRILQPLDTPADRMEVEEILGNLNKLERQSIVTERSENIVQYGLNPPDLIISFDAVDKSGEIWFGGETPIGHDYYSRVEGEEKIFIVAASTHQILDKSLFDLRDKSLFSIKADEIHSVIIARDTYEAEFEKIPNGEETEWRLKSNSEFSVKKDSVEDIIRQFTWLKASSFEQENDDNLQKFGLDKPIVRVTFNTAEGNETLMMSKVEGSTKVYANLQGREGVVGVAERYLQAIPESIEYFLSRLILEFNIEDVRKLSWHFGKDKYELEKNEDSWNRNLPLNLKDAAVDTWLVESALWKLKDMEYYGADVSLSSGKKKIGSVALSQGKDRSLAELTIYVDISGKKEVYEAHIVTKSEEKLYRLHETSVNDLKDTFSALEDTKT